MYNFIYTYTWRDRGREGGEGGREGGKCGKILYLDKGYTVVMVLFLQDFGRLENLQHKALEIETLILLSVLRRKGDCR